MKKFCIKYSLTIISVLIIMLVIFSFLVLSNKLTTKFETYTYIIGLILLFISGFLISNHFQKKGFLLGLIQSVCILLFFFLINTLALNNEMNNGVLVKYLIYLVSGILGGIIGVNIKKIL